MGSPRLLPWVGIWLPWRWALSPGRCEKAGWVPSGAWILMGISLPGPGERQLVLSSCALVSLCFCFLKYKIFFTFKLQRLRKMSLLQEPAVLRLGLPANGFIDTEPVTERRLFLNPSWGVAGGKQRNAFFLPPSPPALLTFRFAFC